MFVTCVLLQWFARSMRVDERRDRDAESFGDLPPAHTLRAHSQDFVTPEDSFWPPDLFAASLGRAHASSDPLADQFALKFRKCCEDVQQESRHRISVVGVKVLC